MIVVPASLRSDFIHMAGMTIHIALESTIHIVGIRTVGTVQPLPDGDKFCLRRGVEKMASNKLYLAVLPMVHLAANQYGLTEQVITLLPGREHATEFFPDEVNEYISIFDRRLKYLIGGHVTGYEFDASETTPEGRVVVKVTQHVR
jgi:hypothetical protein